MAKEVSRRAARSAAGGRGLDERGLRQLIVLLDEAFRGPAWHGPALFASIRGVDADQASWRPAPGRHNIWEVVVHAAYWKAIVIRRLTGTRSRQFSLKGTNWFARPDSGREWRDDVRLLTDVHEELRGVIAQVDPAALARPVHGKNHTAEYTIRGIAAHDLYHAGQIQLLKALSASSA
jgi:DinB family protein